jgi:hypothetical protein
MDTHRRNIQRFLNRLAWDLWQWNLQPKLTLETLKEQIEAANEISNRSLRKAVFARTRISPTEDFGEKTGSCYTVKVKLTPHIRRIDDIEGLLVNPSPVTKTLFGFTIFRKGVRFGGAKKETDIMCELLWGDAA